MTNPREPSRREFLATSIVSLVGLSRGSEIPAWREDSQLDAELLYVGTYTGDGRRDGIYLVHMDRRSGELKQVGSVDAGPNPSFLAIDPNGRVLYAVNEVEKYNGRVTGAVSAFGIARDTGALTRLGEQPSEGSAPCFVSVDREGRVVLVANYYGGNVALLPIQSDGALAAATAIVKHVGSGPKADRQSEPHAHCIVADPSNRFALAADLGADRVFVYRLDLDGKSLHHVDGGDAVMRAGAGPRHIAFHPTLPLVFITNELDSTVATLRFDAVRGALSVIDAHSTLPAGWSGTNYPADIHVAPSGHTLYVSNRGHNSIAVFSVAATGALTLDQVVATGGDWPRNFSLDPSGRWLLVANQKSNSIIVFARDEESGRLTSTRQRIALPSPVCLQFLAHPQSTTNTVYDRVILGGRVMDPESGLDEVRNIGLLDGRIAVITTQAVSGRDTIDARGLVVAPGFIDIHTHGQDPETYRYYSLDGVTTALELELGTSDVDAWYRERSAGERINYGVSIGHIKVRMAVMHDAGTWMPVGDGAYRAASPAQIGEIVKRIEIGLSEGAVDIGAGFPYTPAATRDELLAVFRVAAKTKTPVHVHITPGVAGLKEVLSLAGETNAPLHVVHINSAALAETPVMLEMIRDARAHGRDVTTEAYPYDAGMTEIKSATIQDVYKSAPDERLAELEWQRTGERLNRESFARYSKIGGPVVVHTNTEQMVEVAIKSPLTIVASDAYWQNGTGHPRTTGTFARVLGRYVREAHALSLMEAIRKMTLMPAQRLEARVPSMREKGRVRVGADADITVFDAATVVDRSTYREPSLSPVGIQHVIVNGVSVVANGRAVDGVAPGKPVRAFSGQ